MSKCFLCNFNKRSFLYQVLIIIAALKLRNAFRYNKEFYQRIEDFIESINLPDKLLTYLPKNKEYTHKGFLITLIVTASFSILGLNFFKILSGIGCILSGFLYHNPIPKIKIFLQKKEACSWEIFEQNLPDLEFILYICLAFAMFANAFCPGTCEKDKKEVKPEGTTINITKEEIVELVKEKKEKKEKKENKNDKKANKKTNKKKKE